MKTFICTPFNGNLCIELKKALNYNQKQLLKVFYKKGILENSCSTDLAESVFNCKSSVSVKLSEYSLQWRLSGVIFVNSEYISHLVLEFLLLTLNM